MYCKSLFSYLDLVVVGPHQLYSCLFQTYFSNKNVHVCSSCTVTLMLGTTESQLTSSRWLLPLEVPTEPTHITCSLVVDAVKRALFCSGLHLLSSFHHFKFTCFLQELTRQFWPLFDIATDTLSNIWYLFFLWVGQKNCLIFIIYSTKVLKQTFKSEWNSRIPSRRYNIW